MKEDVSCILDYISLPPSIPPSLPHRFSHGLHGVEKVQIRFGTPGRRGGRDGGREGGREGGVSLGVRLAAFCDSETVWKEGGREGGREDRMVLSICSTH